MGKYQYVLDKKGSYNKMTISNSQPDQDTSSSETNLRIKHSLLIICQGPIISEGMNGGGKWVSYNCLKNIKLYSDSIRLLNYVDFLLVLWSDDFTSEVSDFLVKNNIKYIVREPVVVKSPNKFIKPEMKKNLYSGTYEGLKFSEGQGYTHVFRVRTDQYVDFIPHIHKINHSKKDQLVVLGIDTMEPDSLLDLAFGGRFSSCLDLFDRLTHGKEMHRSIHYDMFYHLPASTEFKRLNNLIYRFYFFIVLDRRPYINRILEENVETLDNFNFNDLIWRGSPWLHKGRYISKVEFNQRLKKTYTISRHKDVIPGIDYLLLPFRIIRKCLRVCFFLQK